MLCFQTQAQHSNWPSEELAHCLCLVLWKGPATALKWVEQSLTIAAGFNPGKFSISLFFNLGSSFSAYIETEKNFWQFFNSTSKRLKTEDSQLLIWHTKLLWARQMNRHPSLRTKKRYLNDYAVTAKAKILLRKRQWGYNSADNFLCSAVPPSVTNGNALHWEATVHLHG